MAGAVDNYLNDEEKAYFESGGKNEDKIEYEDTNGNDESEPEDSTGESESSHESDEPDARRDAEAEESNSEDYTDEDDAVSEGTGDSASKRDYEKAFKTERHKRKELKEALEAQARKTSEIEATLNAMREQQTKTLEKSIPEEQAPDPDEDPMGYQQYKINQLEKYAREQNKYLHDQHKAQQAQAQKQAFMNQYQNSAKQFAEKATDFPEAYKFLTQARMSEHIEAGFSPEEANALLIEEELSIVAKAYNDKVNPAERIYKLAKARGFATDKKAANTVKDFKAIEKGVKASRSLKDGGGIPPDKDLGFDDIDNMDFGEFDKFWDKFKSKQKGR